MVIESLKGIRATDSLSYDRGLKLYSVPDAIAKALEITLGIISFKTSPLSDQGRRTGTAGEFGVSASPADKKEVTSCLPPFPFLPYCIFATLTYINISELYVVLFRLKIKRQYACGLTVQGKE